MTNNKKFRKLLIYYTTLTKKGGAGLGDLGDWRLWELILRELALKKANLDDASIKRASLKDSHLENANLGYAVGAHAKAAGIDLGLVKLA